jgi:hypothetical protein
MELQILRPIECEGLSALLTNKKKEKAFNIFL